MKDERAYTYDELTQAVSQYAHAKSLWVDSLKNLEAANNMVKQRTEEADLAQDKADRWKAEIKKIMANLEK